MKKSLLALAALSAFATAAQAQSSVTVYGVLDVNYTSVDSDAAGSGSATAMAGQSLGTSRLGFKGSEDLGGGLKAEFQLETRLAVQTGNFGNSADTTEAGRFNRESWAGLSSAKYGSIRLGLTDVTSAQGFDTTVSQMGDLGNTGGDIGADKSQTARYTSPTISGFTFELGHSNGLATTDYTTDATASTTAAGKITSAAAKYEMGKLGLYAGLTESKTTATYERKDQFVGAKYDFGVASVGVAYRTLDAADAAGGTDAAFGKMKQTVISVAAPVSLLGSGVKAHAAYHKSDSATGDRTVTTAAADALGVADSKKTTLALTKGFSKRTTGYTGVVETNFDAASKADTTTYIIGVNHVF